MEAQEDLIAAEQHIVEALETKKTSTDEEDEGLDEIELQLNRIQDKVMNWEKDQSMTWDCGPQEAYDCIKAVDEARKLIEFLKNRSSNNGNEDAIVLRRARDVLQTAMARLQDEFRHLLVQNRQPFEPQHVVQRDIVERASEEYVIELMPQDVISDLKSIARLMFDSNYGRECSQVFIDVQKHALDDCLYDLEVEKLTIEDVLKMDQYALELKIRRWIRATKLFVRVYLVSKKTLTDQIFGELESVSSACFTESSKAAILQLQFLSLCKAIAIIPHQPQELFWILDMYHVLADLMPDIVALFPDEAGSCVRIECQGILERLGDCARATFLEFENRVAASVPASALHGGGVDPLTRDIITYSKTLMSYNKTLDDVLRDGDNKSPVSISREMGEDEKNADGSTCSSPMATHLRSLISILECKLDEESKLYEDESLQHLFLMNNIHYVAEQVKNSELGTFLGDKWIRKHNWKFQQHALNYERGTWSSILALLKNEGIQYPYSRTILKERLQSFYLAFEEVYKSQTGWSVPDGQLRDDLRISTSLKVIPAYRTFVGRFHYRIGEKHKKYTADDLENYILDLFEGSQKSLHGGHKK